MDKIILILIFAIYTYIAVKDWKTGLISLKLNFLVLLLAIIYALINNLSIFVILTNFLIFVLPFIIVEGIYQTFGNKEKDEDKFLIGGGDIILFISMSMVLSSFGMLLMFFFASLASLITANVFKKKRIPFAPFLEFGFFIACLFSEKIFIMLFNVLALI